MTNNTSNDLRLCTVYVKPKTVQVSTDNSKQNVKIKSHTKLKKITNWKKIETKNQTNTKRENIHAKQRKPSETPIRNPKGNFKSVQNIKLSLKPKDFTNSKTIRNSISQKIPITKILNTKSEKFLLNNENILGSANKLSSTIKYDLKFPVATNGSPKQSLTDEQMKFQLHSKPNFQYNKGKIEKVQLASQEEQMSDVFRLAVAENGSSNFGENNRLPKLLYKALQQNIPWTVIEKTLLECGAEPIINSSCFLIQLKFQKKIHLICSIRTTNIMNFKKSLMPLLQRHKACYESVLMNFNSSSKIEALASYCTSIDFAKFERNLAKDAVECGAKAIKIIDYETGTVYFQCHPLELPAMVDYLIKKGYRVLYTDYCFRPLDCMDLETEKRKEYTRFLCDLRKYREIENCYDNLLPLLREPEEGEQSIKENK